MNKTKIEWCNMTWNPVTGCLHNCSYCYARKVAKRFYPGLILRENNIATITDIPPSKTNDPFRPILWPSRLDQPAKRKKSTRIFVVSMGDLFGEWVPDEWIEKVFEACERAPQHTYYFLTKNPDRYNRSGIQERLADNRNWWVGYSASCEYTYYMRGKRIKLYARQFLSLEPFHDEVNLTMPLDYVGPPLDPPKWLIVGAQSQPEILPEKKWVLDIREQCDDLGIPLFEKDSLAPLDLPGGLRREWPK